MRTPDSYKEHMASLAVPAEHTELTVKIAADLLPTPYLPFAPLEIPKYKPYVSAKYSLKRVNFPILIGYFTGIHAVSHAIFVLSEHTEEGMRPWMSTETMELESHMPHIAAAHGNVVICGLGMGIALYNIANKDSVKKVYVVEHDKKVVNAFKDFSRYSDWSASARQKIVFIVADVEADSIDVETIDYMYVDTWDTLYGLVDVEISRRCYRKLLRGNRPRYVGFWGQELHYASWCLANDHDHKERKSWDDFLAHLGLPLMVPENIPDDTYFGMCHTAWYNIFDGHARPFG